MTEAIYLDIHELAEVLDISAGSIRRRLKRAPYELPAPAHLGQDFPLRWREHEVLNWLHDNGLKNISLKNKSTTG
jgi:predicted DNA-binding transcriptional regulator AlpA